uniref:DD caspase n=1 Tax=Hydra vulgaris TaxID=6087 RepID=D1MAR3_HYDVU|nr:DD caspase [Hydra vulgaris]
MSSSIGTYWVTLGRALGIKDSVLEVLDKENPKVIDKAYAMLKHWTAKNTNATIDELKNVLRELERNDLKKEAEEIASTLISKMTIADKKVNSQNLSLGNEQNLNVEEKKSIQETLTSSQQSLSSENESTVTDKKPNQAQCYPMTRKKLGKLFIFNNMHNDKKTTHRLAAKYDVKKIKATFSKIEFEVVVYKPNSFEEMKKNLEEVLKEPYGEYNIFSIFFIAHGEDGILFGPNEANNKKSFSILELKEMLEDNSSLKNIPKLVFCESCRGFNKDFQQMTLTNFEAKSNEKNVNTAKFADLFIGFSTAQSFVSISMTSDNDVQMRNFYSPWVIELCKQIQEKYMTTDFLQIYQDLQQYMSHTPLFSNGEEVYFQMPELQSTLKYKLYLNMERKT